MNTNDRYTVTGAEKHTPRVKEPFTDISIEQLVDFIAKHGIGIAKTIRYNNGSFTGATAHVDGPDMLRLWKEVSRRQAASGPADQQQRQTGS